MPSDEPVSAEDRTVLTRPAAGPDATWSYGPAREQVADVYLPPGATQGVLVLVHGGFWRPEYDRVHLRPLAVALAAAGHVVVSLEYARRPGRPDDTTADLVLAMAALPGLLSERGVPDARVLIVGHSAGGHLVLWLATATASIAQGAVGLAPVADLLLAESLGLDSGAVGDFLGSGADGRPDLDPVRSGPPRLPVTVIHGTDDAIVPITLSRAYAQAHERSVRLVELAGEMHFAVIDPLSTAWPVLLAEVERLLAAAPAANSAVPGPAGIE